MVLHDGNGDGDDGDDGDGDDDVGIFGIDDGDGSKNFTLKRHSHCFKHCRIYSNPLKMSTVMEFH